jgi:hypothetical protein
MAGKIETHHDLRVYQKAFQAAMQVFDLSKAFPREETYSRAIKSAGHRALFARI